MNAPTVPVDPHFYDDEIDRMIKALHRKQKQQTVQSMRKRNNNNNPNNNNNNNNSNMGLEGNKSCKRYSPVRLFTSSLERKKGQEEKHKLLEKPLIMNSPSIQEKSQEEEEKETNLIIKREDTLTHSQRQSVDLFNHLNRENETTIHSLQRELRQARYENIHMREEMCQTLDIIRKCLDRLLIGNHHLNQHNPIIKEEEEEQYKEDKEDIYGSVSVDLPTISVRELTQINDIFLSSEETEVAQCLKDLIISCEKRYSDMRQRYDVNTAPPL
ncbi:uncharacterized protein TM35_000083570 [Trypanosoma theileri]|uniref:Uncharacterized protein n=1 Tax=Trypanosoma theileri TaxID=67003 RepID=A0A1X0P217_9TRYP|nr:uncharacterized protein TM35_000083570 [Trypanosoma theileri]ORC90559.1 hypothetical protein TM35_000083570 [Trypanosoma theileri]